MSTHIVIPIGVAHPGSPFPHLLIKSINSILQQDSHDFILTIAADSNVPDEIKKILEEKEASEWYGRFRIKWFSPHSFFAPGGIWKKITDCWKEVDTKYVAFLHYDDLWHKEKLHRQVNAMERENLLGSWSSTYIIDGNDNLVSGDVASWSHFTASTVTSRTPAFAHSIIVNRDAFFNCGIMKYEMKWSPLFEELYTIYMHKIGQMRKVEDAIFYWRSHENNMTSTVLQPNNIYQDIVEMQRQEAKYPNEDVTSDHHFVVRDIQEEIRQIQMQY